MKKENVVVKKSTFEHLAPSGRGWHAVPGEGVLDKEYFISTPSSPLWGTSPARGEVNGGFTLIELLVVVLIIGILTAVAMPQYQKAVEKSRATEAIALLDSAVKSAQVYYLVNGKYPNKFNLMDVDMPSWTGNIQGYTNNITDTRSNEDWSLQISHSSSDFWYLITLTRLSGPYVGAGWQYRFYDKQSDSSITNEIQCLERKSLGIAFQKNQGDYCSKIFNGTYDRWSSAYEYKMP